MRSTGTWSQWSPDRFSFVSPTLRREVVVDTVCLSNFLEAPEAYVLPARVLLPHFVNALLSEIQNVDEVRTLCALVCE